MASLIFDLATVLAEPAVARLIAEPGPWWLWSADATRLIAANTSGAKAMGATGASMAMERSYQTTHAFAGQIARIAGNLPADGTPRLERIRLYGRFGSESALAQARRMRAGDIGLVAVTLAGPQRGEARPAATAFVAESRAALALFDRNGLPLAASTAAGAIADVRLDTLIGAGAADVRHRLDANGQASVDLVTGTLQLVALPEAEAILAILPPASRAEAEPAGLRLVTPASETATAEPAELAPADAPAPEPADPVLMTVVETATVIVETLPELAPPAAAEEPSVPQPVVAEPQPVEEAPAADLPEPDAEVADAPAAVEPVAAEPATPEPAPAVSEADAGLALPPRFSWRLDADRRFHGIDQADVAAVSGLTFAEAAERFGMDPQGTFRTALDAARPFSGVPAVWPLGTTRRLSVTLAAFPSQRDGVVQGFAGFGLVGEELAPVAPAAEETHEDGASNSAAEILAAPEAEAPVEDVVASVNEPVADEIAVADAPAAEAQAEEVVASASPSMPDEAPVIDALAIEAAPEAPVVSETSSEAVATETAPAAEPVAEEAAAPEAPAAEPRAPHLTVHTNPPNVVALRTSAGLDPKRPAGTLSPVERNAFREIARALGARPEQDETEARPAATDLPPPAEQGRVLPVVPAETEAKPVVPASTEAAPVTAPQAEHDEAMTAEAGPELPAETPVAEEPVAEAPVVSADVEDVAAPEAPAVEPSFIADLTQKTVDAPAEPEATAPAASVELVAGPSLEATETPDGGDLKEAAEPAAEVDAAGKADEPKIEDVAAEAATADQPAEPATAGEDAAEAEPASASDEAAEIQPVAGLPETAATPETPPETAEIAAPEAPSAPVDLPPFIASGTPFGPLPSAFGATSSEPAAAPTAPAGPAAAPSADVDTRALLDRVPLGLVVHRGNAVLFANRTLLDWTGYADAAALESAGGVARLFAGGGEETTPSITRTDGSTLPVDARLSKFSWAGESAFLFTLRRVEQQETAESDAESATLSELRGRLDEVEQILDTATDGIVIVSPDGAIESMNRSAEALFGYESAEVKGRSITVLFAPESHRSAMDYCDGLMSNGVASVLNDGRQVIGRVKQGGLIPLYMTMGRTGSDQRPKLAAVFRDLTQWKKAEEDLVAAKRQAEQASSQKSDFLAKISHEIRTPLNAIIGFSEVMMEERFGPIGNERYRDYLKDIHSSGGHVLSLINDLLDLSKIEAGKLDLSFTSVDLNDIVQSTVAIMQPQANRERVIIRSSLQGRLPNVVADARSLRQIVLNLLSNSVKFTPAGGQIIISTALSQTGEAVLRVRDTGIGMTETELKAAMEPFRQVATSSNRGTQGTGLGLPLTKALVEANRASFGISSAPNHGTLVEVIFPPTRVLAE